MKTITLFVACALLALMIPRHADGEITDRELVLLKKIFILQMQLQEYRSRYYELKRTGKDVDPQRRAEDILKDVEEGKELPLSKLCMMALYDNDGKWEKLLQERFEKEKDVNARFYMARILAFLGNDSGLQLLRDIASRKTGLTTSCMEIGHAGLAILLLRERLPEGFSFRHINWVYPELEILIKGNREEKPRKDG